MYKWFDIYILCEMTTTIRLINTPIPRIVTLLLCEVTSPIIVIQCSSKQNRLLTTAECDLFCIPKDHFASFPILCIFARKNKSLWYSFQKDQHATWPGNFTPRKLSYRLKNYNLTVHQQKTDLIYNGILRVTKTLARLCINRKNKKCMVKKNQKIKRRQIICLIQSPFFKGDTYVCTKIISERLSNKL